MKTFNLKISCPSIIPAPQQAHVWLENIFNSGLNRAMINRLNLQTDSFRDERSGVVFIIKAIKEEDYEKLFHFVKHNIFRLMVDSSVTKYISENDIKFEKSSNFDELVKKLPELKGIF